MSAVLPSKTSEFLYVSYYTDAHNCYLFSHCAELRQQSLIETERVVFKKICA